MSGIHYLMHVPFEGLGSTECWLVDRGQKVSRSRLFAGEPLPPPETVNRLVVMGGPMGVGDEARHPWMSGEKRFIERLLKRDVPVLGVCLGGQLIADVLGARVLRNEQPEIGWFPVRMQGAAAGCLGGFPEEFMAFHWHGEMFEVPRGARLVASSEACPHQAFICGSAVALQFHLETTPSGVMDLCAHGADDLVAAPYVQSPAGMLESVNRFTELKRLNYSLLDSLFS